MPIDAKASEATAALCDGAAIRAAREYDIPRDVMLSLTRTETGRRVNKALRPWPWTVNRAGDGRWFASRQEALAFALKSLESGARNFDTGCFQINYRWHHGAFASLDEMFDPDANARYAASFLRQLFTEFGDWTVAAGAFHSRTPEYAERYLTRYRGIRSALSDTIGTAPETAVAAAPSQSAALFLSAVAPRGASLVPLPDARRTGILTVTPGRVLP